MSYFTRAEFLCLEEQEFDLDELRAALPAIVEAALLAEDVVGDVMDLITKGNALISVYADDVIDVFSGIAKSQPAVALVIRGFGEAPHDVWMREFRKGRQTQKLGPPFNAV